MLPGQVVLETAAQSWCFGVWRCHRGLLPANLSCLQHAVLCTAGLGCSKESRDGAGPALDSSCGDGDRSMARVRLFPGPSGGGHV